MCQHMFPRYSKPSDMTRRKSSVSVPQTWLENPDLIDAESAEMCAAAWDVMWSMFERTSDFHPDDHFEVLGDQDEANFRYMMVLHARLLEGRPLTKCCYLTSKRGRNSKGV